MINQWPSSSSSRVASVRKHLRANYTIDHADCSRSSVRDRGTICVCHVSEHLGQGCKTRAGKNLGFLNKNFRFLVFFRYSRFLGFNL